MCLSVPEENQLMKNGKRGQKKVSYEIAAADARGTKEVEDGKDVSKGVRSKNKRLRWSILLEAKRTDWKKTRVEMRRYG